MSLGPSDAEAVLGLLSRYPREKGLIPLAEAVLISAADSQRRSRKLVEAADLLRRAVAIRPDSRAARASLLNVLLEASDWTAAEAAARDLITLAPGDASASRGLGFALMRQDRNREAAEALRTSLEAEDDPATRQMLAHVEKGMRDERGMSEKQIAHFHVRYDGDAHEDVGREMLRALDRHFSTLTGVFDHRPAAPIPVILFSQQAYYDASGAPAWSGGVFNHLDGRIRIPIGGLTSSLTPDIDNVLAHEVTHAFIADISRGVCPRDIHEGLAQYMEGKRIASALDPAQLRALADGRVPGVQGFYLGALAFVEHLMGQRGQGGMNDLLRAMGETGNADAAFRQVYGQDHKALTQAFSDRFRLQHGS
jgi:tetratricopeptide (TPR) repeat protein